MALNFDKPVKRLQPWLKIYEEINLNVPTLDDRTLAEQLARHAKERPEAPALMFYDKVFNYGEFDIEVGKLANALRGLGIEKGDVIGLLMPNTPQYAIAAGALSRLGAIGTGLSLLASPPELAYQINDCNAKIVIALSDLAPKLEAMSDVPNNLQKVIVTGAADYLAPSPFELPAISGIKVVALTDVISGASDQCDQVPMHWNDTFMIQYTGGTTGRPKGAQLTIRNLMHNPAINNAMGSDLELGAEVMATPFPCFHIAGFYSLCASVRYACLFPLLPNPRDLELFIKYLNAYPPTRLGAVPALTEMLLATEGFKTVDLSNLKAWGSGAAPISSQTVKALCDRIGDGKLSDAFGMTETTGAYINNPPKRYKFGSVGIPLPTTDIRIMDVETGTKEMPTGEPGEICASGPQVMKGYINLPDETANSLRNIDGRTYMYSGDVGYVDEEGFLFLCDRAKDMLIVGGFKVFSVEIEDKLSSLPLVEMSAIVGEPDKARPGNDIVHLFVQLSEPHKSKNEDELRTELMEFFAANMAVYKKPKAIHFVDAIPLTPIGKIDKKALRAPLA